MASCPKRFGREFEGEEEYLEILGITREQSGKYECKAANEVASADVKQVRVTVNYPPTITESKSNEAATGRQALLRCEASAVPTPDFEWYRDDTRINSANGLEIKSTGSQSLLMVANVTEEHYGNYTCVAANKLGVTNASLYLYSARQEIALYFILTVWFKVNNVKVKGKEGWGQGLVSAKLTAREYADSSDSPKKTTRTGWGDTVLQLLEKGYCKHPPISPEFRQRLLKSSVKRDAGSKLFYGKRKTSGREVIEKLDGNFQDVVPVKKDGREAMGYEPSSITIILFPGAGRVKERSMEKPAQLLGGVPGRVRGPKLNTGFKGPPHQYQV
ncbi:hypothetical protein BTVI_82446 [Pitangus sulphuratus]|nr:hypothetical protein BTVI_82446 [Pitangus sulphuratus]